MTSQRPSITQLPSNESNNFGKPTFGICSLQFDSHNYFTQKKILIINTSINYILHLHFFTVHIDNRRNYTVISKVYPMSVISLSSFR